MNYYKQASENIIATNPQNDCYICTCGIGPTGKIHIGKAFDILCAHFVSNEIEGLNKKTKVVCFIDDCITDLHVRTIDSSSHIRQLKNELKALSISVEFVYSSENYKNGSYNSYLMMVYNHQEAILETINKRYIGKYDKKLSAIFNVYCPYCGALLTDVNSIGDYRFSYTCKCGSHGTDSILNNKTFFRWKIETPIRWHLYNSCFEPAAFNHDGPNGSFIIAKDLYKVLFGERPPLSMFYQYFCDDSGNKFSSRTNIGYTISDLLPYFYPHQITEYLKNINFRYPIKFSVKKMFDDIYYGKRWKDIRFWLCQKLGIQNNTILSIINIAKYYFYDCAIICNKLNLECSVELGDFIKKIQLYQQIMPPKSTEISTQFKNALGNILENNRNLTVPEIQASVMSVKGYSYERFCKEFYGVFFHTESGPPLSKILDCCSRHVYDAMRFCVLDKYTCRNINYERLPSFMTYHFKTFVFDDIKEKIIKLIDTPANKDRYERHVIPVVENVKKISSEMSVGDEVYILIIAAMLHDIAKFQLEGNNNHCYANHAKTGAEWTRRFLRSNDVCECYIEKICRCIENHSVIPTDGAPLDERIIAAADGMAHIDYPWALICKQIQRQDNQPYSVILDMLFDDRLSKSLDKISFSEIRKEYSRKIELLKRLLK